MDKAENKQIRKYVNTKLGKKRRKRWAQPRKRAERLYTRADRAYIRLNLWRGSCEGQLQRCAVAAALLCLHVSAPSLPSLLPI